MSGPRRFAPIALVALLHACGGSDGESITPPPAPTPSPAPPEVQVSDSSPVAAGCSGGVSSGAAFVHSEVEPWLAIDRHDGTRWLAGWQQDRWSNGGARAVVSASSLDGGATWQSFLHPMSRCGGAASGSSGDFERATDPWVEFSPDGTAHFMALATSGPLLVDGSQSSMMVSR